MFQKFARRVKTCEKSTKFYQIRYTFFFWKMNFLNFRSFLLFFEEKVLDVGRRGRLNICEICLECTKKEDEFSKFKFGTNPGCGS